MPAGLRPSRTRIASLTFPRDAARYVEVSDVVVSQSALNGCAGQTGIQPAGASLAQPVVKVKVVNLRARAGQRRAVSSRRRAPEPRPRHHTMTRAPIDRSSGESTNLYGQAAAIILNVFTVNVSVG
jgi:hypothetical protein